MSREASTGNSTAIDLSLGSSDCYSDCPSFCRLFSCDTGCFPCVHLATAISKNINWFNDFIQPGTMADATNESPFNCQDCQRIAVVGYRIDQGFSVASNVTTSSNQTSVDSCCDKANNFGYVDFNGMTFEVVINVKDNKIIKLR